MKKIIELAHQSSTTGVSDQISLLFNHRDKLYYFLLGQTISNEKSKQKEIEDSVPHQLFQYRFLLHPYRLAIMKLLNQYVKMSSVEIKERLSLSWGEYSNTIISLKKKGYISYTDDFEDSSVRRFIYLEEMGRQDYTRLTSLLNTFLSKTDGILNSDDYDNLYPS